MAKRRGPSEGGIPGSSRPVSARPPGAPLPSWRVLHRTLGNRGVQRALADRGGPPAGAPLPAALREQMEKSFRADFSEVRVRTSGALAERGIRALTRGDVIEMAPPSPRTKGPDDRALLAHELAHVLQQREGRARDTLADRSGGAMALEREAGRAARAVAKGLTVPREAGPTHAEHGPVSAQASGPLTDAVDAVRAHGPGVGSTMVTEQLVRGIREAEGEFLRMHPENRLAESLGLSDTVGPGQLGEPAIRSVDSNFSAAATQFESIHGPPPGGWQDKATHPDWSYFYIAAYLAFSINEAARVFHASPPTMTDAALGVLPLGIAMYHGAFETIRGMRRRIAGERSAAASDVSWQMVEDELRSGTARYDELALERYTLLARGAWDFGFEIQAAMLSRRFDVAGGKVRATILADYRSPAAAGASRARNYDVELRKREVACAGGGACGEGYNIVGSFRFTVGTRASAEWTGLDRGTYQMYIRKVEDPYSADVLVGSGRVETIY